eukprot:scaffold9783_cov127-Isochrysis_galbana.AAC.12
MTATTQSAASPSGKTSLEVGALILATLPVPSETTTPTRPPGHTAAVVVRSRRPETPHHTQISNALWVPQPGPKYQVMPGGEKGERGR